MSIDASARNMQAVCNAKEQHDKTCPWGGTGTDVLRGTITGPIVGAAKKAEK